MADVVGTLLATVVGGGLSFLGGYLGNRYAADREREQRQAESTKAELAHAVSELSQASASVGEIVFEMHRALTAAHAGSTSVTDLAFARIFERDRALMWPIRVFAPECSATATEFVDALNAAIYRCRAVEGMSQVERESPTERELTHRSLVLLGDKGATITRALVMHARSRLGEPAIDVPIVSFEDIDRRSAELQPKL